MKTVDEKCCVCLYTSIIGTIIIGSLFFGAYLVILWSLSHFIDTCSNELFHCEVKTYFVAAGVFIGFGLLMICVCNCSEIYRAYLNWSYNEIEGF